MTDEERKIALYCLKVGSDYHSEVCQECIKFHNCDQDDVTETIIKELEKEGYYKELAQSYERTIVKLTSAIAERQTCEKRKTGKWEHGYSFPDVNYVKCTVCGEIIKCTFPMHFCPNCGSDNRGEEQ